MRVQTFLSASEAASGGIVGGTAVVIDVIRATSTIVEALAAGASAVYPTSSRAEALKVAQTLGREGALLCGERGGRRIEGFDLGNSPREFTADRVAGRRLVMTTTNGTRAFVAAERAERVMAASFLNLSSVADAVSGVDRLVLVCAGKEGRLSLDDMLCAGAILTRLARLGEGERELPELDDASRVAIALARTTDVDAEFLRDTAAGRALVDIGLDADLLRCADVDRFRLIPEMHDRILGATDAE